MNVISLTGRMTKDIEERISQSGTKVGTFSLAVRRDGAKQGETNTDFFDCVSFGKTTEILTQYTSKGSMIGVVGKFRIDNYTNKEGQNRKSYKVMVERIDLISSGNQDQHGYNQQPSYQQPSYQQPNQQSFDNPTMDAFNMVDVNDVEYPF